MDQKDNKKTGNAQEPRVGTPEETVTDRTLPLSPLPAGERETAETKPDNAIQQEDIAHLIKLYLLKGEPDTWDRLRREMDNNLPAFATPNGSALFSAIEEMLESQKLKDATAPEIAHRLSDILEHISWHVQVEQDCSVGLFSRIINPLAHPKSNPAENQTVRDLMQSRGNMSFIALREFRDIFEEYHFETTSKQRHIR